MGGVQVSDPRSVGSTWGDPRAKFTPVSAFPAQDWRLRGGRGGRRFRGVIFYPIGLRPSWSPPPALHSRRASCPGEYTPAQREGWHPGAWVAPAIAPRSGPSRPLPRPPSLGAWPSSGSQGGRGGVRALQLLQEVPTDGLIWPGGLAAQEESDPAGRPGTQRCAWGRAGASGSQRSPSPSPTLGQLVGGLVVNPGYQPPWQEQPDWGSGCPFQPHADHTRYAHSRPAMAWVQQPLLWP